MKKSEDIANWADGGELLRGYFLENKGGTATFLSPLDIESKKVYALLTAMVSQNPNGIFTLLSDSPKPMDNLIFWDFAFSHGRTLVHVWQTAMMLEARIYFPPPGFDLKEFLHQNIQLHNQAVMRKMESFDVHTLFINHYKSYDVCISFLWSQIESLDLHEPPDPSSHITDKEALAGYNTQLSRFLDESVRLHAFGKSLVLNCAFACESYLNNLIRIGLNRPLRNFPETVRRYLNAGFTTKLREIPLYCSLVLEPIETEAKEVKNVSNLLTLRNKYVHADETSELNRVGALVFDRDYPLFGKRDAGFGTQWVKTDLHNPSMEQVKWAYTTFREFVGFMNQHVDERHRSEFVFLMDKNPIGFNENKKVYSAVCNNFAASFFMVPGGAPDATGTKGKPNKTSPADR